MRVDIMFSWSLHVLNNKVKKKINIILYKVFSTTRTFGSLYV